MTTHIGIMRGPEGGNLRQMGEVPPPKGVEDGEHAGDDSPTCPIPWILRGAVTMEMTSPTSRRFLGHAFDQLLAVADRLPEPLLNVRPFGAGTNSVASLVVHCCGVVDYWLGHIALGEPTTRDRESEFAATATHAELHQMASATLNRAVCLLDRLDIDDGIDRSGRPGVYGGDGSDAAMVLHVLEECFQHLGHAEVTADALLFEVGES